MVGDKRNAQVRDQPDGVGSAGHLPVGLDYGNNPEKRLETFLKGSLSGLAKKLSKD